MKHKAGIYSITINHKLYIGSSIDIQRRLNQHISDLKCNRHCNIILQNAYNKYREFEENILEEIIECNGKELHNREKYYIEKLKPHYNIQDPITNFGIKKVYQFDLEGKFIKEYNSIIEAANELKISYSNIQHCAQENEKQTKSAGGYLWKYVKNCNPKNDHRHKIIYVYNTNGEYLTYYDTIKECSKVLFPNRNPQFVASMINRICKNKSATLEGFRFSYNKLNQLDNTLLLTIKHNYPIVQLSYDKNEIIKVWENIKSASNELNIRKSYITSAIIKDHRCQGYYWKRLGI